MLMTNRWMADPYTTHIIGELAENLAVHLWLPTMDTLAQSVNTDHL